MVGTASSVIISCWSLPQDILHNKLQGNTEDTKKGMRNGVSLKTSFFDENLRISIKLEKKHETYNTTFPRNTEMNTKKRVVFVSLQRRRSTCKRRVDCI